MYIPGQEEKPDPNGTLTIFSKDTPKRKSRDPTFYNSRGSTTVAQDQGASSKETSKRESRDPTFYDSRGTTSVAEDQHDDQGCKPGGHNRWKLNSVPF
jgi:hypothetical protein